MLSNCLARSVGLPVAWICYLSATARSHAHAVGVRMLCTMLVVCLMHCTVLLLCPITASLLVLLLLASYVSVPVSVSVSLCLSTSAWS